MDEYFFLIVTPECTFEKIGLFRGWIFLEICIFYYQILGTMFFIFISNVTIRESGLQYKEKKEHRTDFLARYDTMASVFTTYFIMFAASLTCAITQTIFYSNSGFYDNVGSQQSTFTSFASILLFTIAGLNFAKLITLAV